jgi:hypothetical protein
LSRPLKSQTVEDYKIHVGQRFEEEAHFVQLLYIDQYESQVEDEEIKKEFKSRLNEALVDKSKRVELIVYSKYNGTLGS